MKSTLQAAVIVSLLGVLPTKAITLIYEECAITTSYHQAANNEIEPVVDPSQRENRTSLPATFQVFANAPSPINASVPPRRRRSSGLSPILLFLPAILLLRTFVAYSYPFAEKRR